MVSNYLLQLLRPSRGLQKPPLVAGPCDFWTALEDGGALYARQERHPALWTQYCLPQSRVPHAWKRGCLGSCIKCVLSASRLLFPDTCVGRPIPDKDQVTSLVKDIFFLARMRSIQRKYLCTYLIPLGKSEAWEIMGLGFTSAAALVIDIFSKVRLINYNKRKAGSSRRLLLLEISAQHKKPTH